MNNIVLLANDVNLLIKDFLNDYFKSIMKKELGENWFDDVRNYIINSKSRKLSTKFIDPINIKSIDEFDPTATTYMILEDKHFSQYFENEDMKIRSKIFDLRDARNTITHNLNSGNVELMNIYLGINAVDKARIALFNKYKDTFFGYEKNQHYLKYINELSERAKTLSDINNNYIVETQNNHIDDDIQPHFNLIKLNKYVNKKILIVIVILAIGVGVFIIKDKNSISGGFGDYDTTYNTNNEDNQKVIEEEEQTDNYVLDNAIDKVTSNFSAQLLGIDFGSDSTTVHLHFKNNYSKSIIMTDTALTVGKIINTSGWIDGQLPKNQIPMVSEIDIDLYYPAMEHNPGDEVQFTIQYQGGLDLINKASIFKTEIPE